MITSVGTAIPFERGAGAWSVGSHEPPAAEVVAHRVTYTSRKVGEVDGRPLTEHYEAAACAPQSGRVYQVSAWRAAVELGMTGCPAAACFGDAEG
ncbi:hypothetical protein [Catenuloplanes japonicus]|uniref:hypothetical protein n=1 Tax=Catenuloplanes japonicus TaxID=33876 RepID=UPI0005245A5D|nr:hypothetical protein [Catenuloplanes japonicus]